MPTSQKVVRQSVTLPAWLAKQVRSMAKKRRVRASRMVAELVEQGIDTRLQKEKLFFELAGKFREASKPEEVDRLGEELGRMIFGE